MCLNVIIISTEAVGCTLPTGLGNNRYNVIVSIGGSRSINTGMLLHANNENTPPAVTTNLELVTCENMPIIISLVAQDPNNDLVTFSIASLPR